MLPSQGFLTCCFLTISIEESGSWPSGEILAILLLAYMMPSGGWEDDSQKPKLPDGVQVTDIGSKITRHHGLCAQGRAGN